jgi:hypothetical protein
MATWMDQYSGLTRPTGLFLPIAAHQNCQFPRFD